jgi:mobilome CxxCx(11)CxxC protein
MDDAIIKLINQKKLDSLAAKHLHGRSRSRLNRLNHFVDYLAIAVPILYFVPRFIAKGTPYAFRVEIAWECIAALLVAVVFLKINYHWEERAQTHSKLQGENISLVRQADELLLMTTGGIPETAQLFLRLAEKSESADREAMGDISAKDKQFAYRESLKEIGDPSIRCPICHASPWKFISGSCQLCGNRPEPQLTSNSPIVHT